jgi:hypothetical protein
MRGLVGCMRVAVGPMQLNILCFDNTREVLILPRTSPHPRDVTCHPEARKESTVLFSAGNSFRGYSSRATLSQESYPRKSTACEGVESPSRRLTVTPKSATSRRRDSQDPDTDARSSRLFESNRYRGWLASNTCPFLPSFVVLVLLCGDTRICMSDASAPKWVHFPPAVHGVACHALASTAHRCAHTWPSRLF